MKLWNIENAHVHVAFDNVRIPVGFGEFAHTMVDAHNAEVRDSGDDVVQRLLTVLGAKAVPTPLEEVLGEYPRSAILQGALSPYHEAEYLHRAGAWMPFRAAVAERVRQIGVKGYTAEHDDTDLLVSSGQLASYAAWLALPSTEKRTTGELYPWPAGVERRYARQEEIVRAMACLAAEWDRLERQKRVLRVERVPGE